MSTNQIKAVVFDMDGVLIDAREWHYLALNRALELFGFHITKADHLETYDGLPTKRKLEILSKERNLPLGLHGFIDEMKQQFTMEMIHTKCRPVFARQYALSMLKRDGFILGVASNSIKETVTLMMEKSALNYYLDFQLSASDVTKAKPNPEIYLEALIRTGYSGSEVVVVEDNENGIRAAEAAGCHVYKVKNPDSVTYQNIIEFINSLEVPA